jgi:hypothetical protein
MLTAKKLGVEEASFQTPVLLMKAYFRIRRARIV